MKKRLAMVLAAAMVLSTTACGSSGTAATAAPASTEAKTEAAKTEATTAEKVENAQSTGSLAGKKIAVVRNLAAGDHTQQFLDGCVSEGKKFGWTVDTFVTDGDDAKAQETVAQVIAKDYQGIIVSHGQLSYSYDMLKPARDKGMEVVTFDTMPFKGGDASGELLSGVTSTAQNDQALAELSLGYMMKEFEA